MVQRVGKGLGAYRLDVLMLAIVVAWEAIVIVRWQQDAPDFSALRVLGSAVTSFLYVSSGIVARHRTPYPRMGAMLFVAGFCWMVEDISILGGKIDANLTPILGASSAFGFGLAAFAFPTGRLRGRGDLLLVTAIGVDSFVIGPLSSLSYSCVPGGPNCTGWAMSYFHTSDGLNRFLDLGPSVVGFGVLGGAAGLFVYRWLRSTRPERRMVAPFLVACLFIAIINVPKVIDSEANPVGNFLPLSFGLAPLGLLAGLARVRMVRVGVTSIVRQLDSATSVPQLRDILRRSLGDKSIEIWTWSSAAGVWLGEGGATADGSAAEGPGMGWTQIDGRDGKPLGALLHDPALSHDPELLEAVVGAIRLALENASLHDEVSLQLARAADAEAGERRRVARDLHDGAQQRLVSLMYDVAALENILGPAVSPEIQRRLGVIQDGARGALADLRRLVHGLSPATLEDEGVGNAIRELVLGVPVEVVVDDRLEGRLPPAVESAAYLMTAEALTNVTKHSGARAARVLLEQVGNALHVAISDDGRGGADPSGGTGLRGLQERAAAFGGHVVVSSPPGKGTTVGIEIPLTARATLRAVGA